MCSLDDKKVCANCSHKYNTVNNLGYDHFESHLCKAKNDKKCSDIWNTTCDQFSYKNNNEKYFELFDVEKFEQVDYEQAINLFSELYKKAIKIYLTNENIVSRSNLLKENRKHLEKWLLQENNNWFNCLTEVTDKNRQNNIKDLLTYKAYFLVEGILSKDEYPILQQLYSIPKEIIQDINEKI